MSEIDEEVLSDYVDPTSFDTSHKGYIEEWFQPASFTEYFHRRQGMPWWVETENGSKYLTCFHTVWLDLAFEHMSTGVNVANAWLAMHNPPDDGLVAVAEQRGDSFRYIRETKKPWMKRLANAWYDHSLMGTVPGLIRQLTYAGYEAAVQRDFTAWPEGNKGAPPLVTTAVDTQSFQFVLVIGVPDDRIHPPTWGGGAVWTGENGEWGVNEWTEHDTFGAGRPVQIQWKDIDRWWSAKESSLLFAEEIEEIRQIARKWKPMDFSLTRIVILSPGAYNKWVRSDALRVDSQPIWNDDDVEHHPGL